LEEDAEGVAKAVIAAAKGGDIIAARLVLERICPARKDRHVNFALPEMRTTADLVKASAALLNAVATGELTPSEAAEIGKLVEAHAKTIEVVELHARLERLERLTSQ
jgi:hypothetical protein